MCIAIGPYGAYVPASSHAQAHSSPAAYLLHLQNDRNSSNFRDRNAKTAMPITLPEQPHTVLADELVQELRTDPEQGLSAREVATRRETYGPNRLERQKHKPLLLIFAEQFLSPVIYVLAGAGLLAVFFGEYIEAVAVGVVILVTALIGFFMEWQALRSMETLRQMAQVQVRVLRDGAVQQLSSEEVVPGDILLLEVGDVVPADGRVLRHEQLAVKEAALTGESNQVEKQLDPLPADTPLAERSDMVFKGTLVSRGSARVLVTATGEQTELGKISRMTREAEKESTPLEKKLNRLSLRLIWLTLGLTVVIGLSGWLQGKDLLLMIETAIALAVAAIPEGLPIVATIALARGMLRLADKQVVIKKLEAVQTLGETGIICTDKTGTLTENQMAAHRMVHAGASLELDEARPGLAEADELARRLLEVGLLCNNVQVDGDLQGDPVEVALVELARQLEWEVAAVRERYPERFERPFDTDSKMMATANERPEGGYRLHVKGALENVLQACAQIRTPEGVRDLTNEDAQHWNGQADALAAEGLRILAFAYADRQEEPREENTYDQLTFLGLVGFLDPPRKEVAPAIRTCREAGIRVVMVTGDHPQTARKIAEEVGLIETGAEDARIVHSNHLPDLEAMTPEQEEELLEAVVFARVTPEQKLFLVDFYQANNYVVGMTGDGVNDAPALKKADIGIAMGIRGTEAAKEVADVILKDDRFTSIELAIRQGRIIFENIREFVVYLLSSNLAEIISVAIASLTVLPLPLLPLQILYLNLVTDVFPALALGMNEGEKGLMKDPPRPSDEPILPRRLWLATITYGLSITAAVIGITFFADHYLMLEEAQVNNLAFYTLVLAQLLNVFNMPRHTSSFWNNAVTHNLWVWGAILLCILLTAMGYLIPVLREALSLVPLPWEYLGWVGAFGLGALVLAQIVKRIARFD